MYTRGFWTLLLELLGANKASIDSRMATPQKENSMTEEMATWLGSLSTYGVMESQKNSTTEAQKNIFLNDLKTIMIFLWFFISFDQNLANSSIYIKYTSKNHKAK